MGVWNELNLPRVLWGLTGQAYVLVFRLSTTKKSCAPKKLFKLFIFIYFIQVRQRMGYCPQFDALIDLMTGRELLWMYCRLRGVPEEFIPDTVNKLSKDLSVYDHIDKCTKTYR